MVARYILPPVWLWPRLNAAVRCWGETRTGPFRNKFACGGSGIKHTRTKVYNQSVGNIIVIPKRRAAGILRVIGCYNQLVTIKLMLNCSVARQWTAVQCNIAFWGTFSALYLLLATVSTSETTAPVSTRSVSTIC